MSSPIPTPSAVAEHAAKGNLLKNALIGGFIRSRWFPGILQWPTLLVFAVIIYALLLGPIAAHAN